MADKKRPKDPDKKSTQEPDESKQAPRHDPRGRDHQVHQEILERRMKGGREPDPGAFRNALEQWKRLPGSIVRPPTDITAAPPEEKEEREQESAPSDQPGSESSADDNEQNDRERQP